MSIDSSGRNVPTSSRPRLRTDPHQPASWATIRNPRDLGRFITRVRVATGWTQKDLARHLGFPVRYLHEIESGKDTLAYTRLFALLRALHLDLQLSTPDAADLESATEPVPGSDPASPSSTERHPADPREAIEDWEF